MATRASKTSTSSSSATKPLYVVRRSKVHGTGVFAARNIVQGTSIFEYAGERISWKEADRRHPIDPDEPNHTFFFALSNGKVIDGGVDGSDARWVNHGCDPNCEADETDDHRVFIKAVKDIKRGQELNYDYGLVIEERMTPTLKKAYLCLCGAANCRGTMLAKKQKRPDLKPAAKKTAKKSEVTKKASAKKVKKAAQ